MKNQTRKRFSRFLCLFLALTALSGISLPVSAAPGTRAYSWYCKGNMDHRQPILEKQIAFIENYGFYVDRHAENEKVIYLTFDAGYENGNVEKILDVLKAHNAPGAFFILDNLLNRRPDLVNRMANEGHLVCNHTSRHPDMSKITDRACFDRQLQSLEKHYEEVTGRQMAKYYRPPEGRFTEQNLQFANDLGYKTVFWSFAYADWDNNKQPDPEKALKKILDHAHNGEIMLLHPTSATNAQILDRLLTALENDHYRFGTLDEIKM